MVSFPQVAASQLGYVYASPFPWLPWDSALYKQGEMLASASGSIMLLAKPVGMKGMTRMQSPITGSLAAPDAWAGSWPEGRAVSWIM